MKALKYVLILTQYLFVLELFAQQSSQEYVYQSVDYLLNHSELESHTLDAIKSKEQWRKTCAFEKQQQIFPTSCFNLVQLYLKLSKSNEDKEFWKQEFKEMCIQESVYIKNKLQIYQLLDKASWILCKTSLLKRLKELDYQAY